MSQPILSLVPGKSTCKAAVNSFPCRIHHDGTVTDVEPFWQPAKTEDGSSVAYLRGRKLHGRTVTLPKGYRGVVVERTADTRNSQHTMPPASHEPEDESEDAQGPETAKVQLSSEFDEIVVWGHEALADANGDPLVRSMEEWLEVADKIHGYESNSDGQK